MLVPLTMDGLEGPIPFHINPAMVLMVVPVGEGHTACAVFTDSQKRYPIAMPYADVVRGLNRGERSDELLELRAERAALVTDFHELRHALAGVVEHCARCGVDEGEDWQAAKALLTRLRDQGR